MAIDFQEWAAARGPKQIKKANSSAIAALTQAQPALELLTDSPQWDLFLSYIASAIETWKKDHAKLSEALSKSILGIDEVLRVRHAMVVLSERINTAQYISQLPKDLISAGDKALALEARFEEQQAA